MDYECSLENKESLLLGQGDAYGIDTGCCFNRLTVNNFEENRD